MMMVQHGGRIDSGAVGYIRNVELARRVLRAISTRIWSRARPRDETVEAILWGGASSRSAEIVRMALERINWARDDPRWFWVLGARCPGIGT